MADAVDQSVDIPNEPIKARERRVRRPWRIAFIAYAALVFVLTHWPALSIVPEEYPSPDKLVHVIVFAGWVIWLFFTRWVKTLRLLWVIGIAYAVFDELTQSMPGLGRQWSYADMASSMIGVTVAVIWLWALRPIGGWKNRLRLRQIHFVFEEMFTRWKTWLRFGGVSGAAALAVGYIAFAFYLGETGRVNFDVPAIAGLITLLVTIWLLLVWRWPMHAGRIFAAQPCLTCGASVETARVDDDTDTVSCTTCSSRQYTWQWEQPPGRAFVPPVANVALAFLFSALMLIGFGYAFALADLAVGSLLALESMNLTAQFQPGLLTAMVFSGVAVCIVLSVYVLREMGAFRIDNQNKQCLKCRHDLRGTPIDHGIGTCGECGQSFIGSRDQP